VPRITSKRFQKQDVQEFIWLDIHWTAREVDKPFRAVKGTLQFADLFGEVKASLGWTIVRETAQGQVFDEKGVGFEYNQFSDSDDWVLATDLKDMKVTFSVLGVVYQDGTIEGGSADVPKNSLLVPRLIKKRMDSQDFEDFGVQERARFGWTYYSSRS